MVVDNKQYQKEYREKNKESLREKERERLSILKNILHKYFQVERYGW